MTDSLIYGPTPEARLELLAGFVMSGADWSRRAIEARARGDIKLALTFECVARVADSVAKRGVL